MTVFPTQNYIINWHIFYAVSESGWMVLGLHEKYLVLSPNLAIFNLLIVGNTNYAWLPVMTYFSFGLEIRAVTTSFNSVVYPFFGFWCVALFIIWHFVSLPPIYAVGNYENMSKNSSKFCKNTGTTTHFGIPNAVLPTLSILLFHKMSSLFEIGTCY